MVVDVSLSREKHPAMCLDDAEPWVREDEIERRIENRIEVAFNGCDVCVTFEDEDDDVIEVRGVVHRSEVIAVVQRIVDEEVRRG